MQRWCGSERVQPPSVAESRPPSQRTHQRACESPASSTASRRVITAVHSGIQIHLLNCQHWTKQLIEYMLLITFCVSRRRRKMYCGHPRLCVCPRAACLHYCMDPDVTWGSGRGCPLVVHYWADLQSGHGLRCYDNISRTRNVSEYMLVLALCLV